MVARRGLATCARSCSGSCSGDGATATVVADKGCGGGTTRAKEGGGMVSREPWSMEARLMWEVWSFASVLMVVTHSGAEQSEEGDGEGQQRELGKVKVLSA